VWTTINGALSAKLPSLKPLKIFQIDCECVLINKKRTMQTPSIIKFPTGFRRNPAQFDRMMARVFNAMI
jgi:hypothetical protein